MNNTQKKDVFQTPDADALQALKSILTDAKYGSLSTLSPDDGHPMCSRVGVATLDDTTPVVLVSELSDHTQAMLADPRCSIMVGEVGKGDPLTHGRVTMICSATPIQRDAPEHANIRTQYLASHPKAKLYVDFGDFMFIALTPLRAHYVAGFGSAYHFSSEDLKLDDASV